jgi:hypothetical protein
MEENVPPRSVPFASAFLVESSYELAKGASGASGGYFAIIAYYFFSITTTALYLL